MVLSITHHSLERYEQYRGKGQDWSLPRSGGSVLDDDQARGMRPIVKSLLKYMCSAKRVITPLFAVKEKFMKHGAVQTIYYHNGRILFTIVQERKKDTLVTCARIFKDRSRKLEVEQMVADPMGSAYVKDVDKVTLPYRYRGDRDFSVQAIKDIPVSLGFKG